MQNRTNEDTNRTEQQVTKRQDRENEIDRPL
jgi:hypothetical protein